MEGLCLMKLSLINFLNLKDLEISRHIFGFSYSKNCKLFLKSEDVSNYTNYTMTEDVLSWGVFTEMSSITTKLNF